mmetsp:Transcript_43184/g.111527  ORF Transcript_43184/g.111527 Transcript_43184/m.111527 type:complete len:434 (-) Transcript_43184:249-1550(-)
MAPKKGVPPPEAAEEDEEDEEMTQEETFQGVFTFPDLSEYAGDYVKTNDLVGKVVVIRDEENEAGFSVEMGRKFLVIANLDPSRKDLSLMRNGDIVRCVNGEKVPGLDEYKGLTEEAKEFTLKLYREKVILHGRGKLTAGPESFEGVFERGSYASGTFVGIDSSKYTGSFRSGAYHGPGEYSWPDGRLYKGMWQDGKMHGRGRFENFSFGVDRVFEGFCAGGVFQSGEHGQEEAKRSFLAEYGTALMDSAGAALREMASRVKTPEDAKGKKGAVDDSPAEIPKEFLVPVVAEGEEDKVATAERAAVEELAEGPFAEAAGLPTAAALQAFSGLFAPSADLQPPIGQVTLYEERGQKGRFDGCRLKRQQLEYIGQAVEFYAPEAEPGSLSFVVLLNASSQYGAAQARWKLLHHEDVPRPATSGEAEADDKKGKKK